MDPQVLLDMLGVTTVEAAAKALTSHNQVITSLKAATGATNLDGVQAKVNSNAAVSAQIEALTGKTGGEAVALVTAWKSGAADTEKAKAETAALKKANEEADCKALLDKAVADGQLEPSKRGDFEALNTKFGPEALKLSLAALPAPTAKTPGGSPSAGAPRQPVVGGAQTGPASDDERAIMKATGKSLDEIRTAAKEWDEADKDGKAVVVTRRAKAA